MIPALLFAAAVPLAWEGTAVVHSGATTIPITVRTRVEASGRVVSESWPTAIGEAKGLRRFILEPSGEGTIERGGRSEPAPAAFAREEVAQFGFYQQLQVAVIRCGTQKPRGAGSHAIVVHAPGAVPTAFRCRFDNLVTTAANWVAAGDKPVRQDFRMIGYHWESRAVFPRRLIIRRDGKPFFDLTVTRFKSPGY